MKVAFQSYRRQRAQTFIFFMLAWGMIMLLCGLGIDSGLLYLAKARMGRAVDGAALEAVGNFNRSPNPITNRDQVAFIMRNFAVANFTDLAPISTVGSGTAGGDASTYTATNGTTATRYTYNFNDGTQDANSQYRRFVKVVLNVGTGGAITSATCEARCPVQTFFIGYATYLINGKKNVKIGGYSGPSSLADLKVSSEAVATRNPRLIMVVIDRSASMLRPGGGASGLPPAIVQFLDFFDTSSDNIGIVSFGSSARLEVPLTTNFIIAATNNLINAYATNSSGGAEPPDDPEDVNEAAFATNGVRRLKFGGQTAADEGIRLGLEQLMANSGFNDPDVVKYMVIFTDGKWNASRTLFAAPGYTNEIVAVPADTNHLYNVTNPGSVGKNNGDTGPWVASTNLVEDANLIPVPSLGLDSTRSSLPLVPNAINQSDKVNGAYNDFSILVDNHTNDWWQSIDSSGYEPIGSPSSASKKEGIPEAITNTTWVGQSSNGQTNYYTHDLDVWLQPGSVAYYRQNGGGTTPYVSDYTVPNKHIYVRLQPGDKLDLVVPGYVIDGIFFDGLDLAYSDPENSTTYPRYRANNYQEAFMWTDDTAPYLDTPAYLSTSLQRQLMFRNYPNLLTGFYLFRPDEPIGPGNNEPLITELNTNHPPGAPRSLYPLGPYYPSAGFYWPFDLVGVDYDTPYALRDPKIEPDPQYSSGYFGGSRHIAYSINMLSTNAAPEWSGELFYRSTSGAGTNTYSGTGSTPESQIMQSGDWRSGAPDWLINDFAGEMYSEGTHNANILGSPSVWRPLTFNGSNSSVNFNLIAPDDAVNHTGGYVTDGQGHYFRNTMAWSGRPTHYYDFSQAKWIKIANNHISNIQALALGNWKANEYAWHARALGVTIYTIGYGSLVNASQCEFLAQLANSTNTILPDFTTNPSAYNPSQPIGQQFYATNAAQISNDFYSVGQAINAALTR